MIPRPPRSTLFPYTTSSDLVAETLARDLVPPVAERALGELHDVALVHEGDRGPAAVERVLDRLRSEEHTSELQSHHDLVCRLLLEKINISLTYADSL